MSEPNSFMINNFKIFEGEHWFSFKDLNVFTGANNSGKSTFIQALKLFAEGFKNSDFPTLDLLTGTENLGGFNNVLNYNSDDKKFGFGFRIQMDDINKVFDVHYKFMKGSEDDNKGMATFYSFEIKDGKEIFFGIYDHYKCKREVESFESPHDDGDSMSMLIGKLNTNSLRKYIKKISSSDFSEILNYFDNNFPDYWWFELIEEWDTKKGEGNTIFDKRFSDLLQHLKKDDYLNLAKFNMKEDICFSDETDIRKYEAEKYEIIKNRTDFPMFIERIISKIIEPVINYFESYLQFFSDKNMIQVKPTDLYQKEVIPYEGENKAETEILTKIIQVQDEFEFKLGFFIEKSINVFFEEGKNEKIKKFNLRVEKKFNFGYTINLEHFIEREIKEKSSSKGEVSFSFGRLGRRYPDDYDKVVNIADLGKGTNNLLILILKTASIIFDNEDSKVKKLILIEEPETYLHPAWQSKLADFFVYCMKNHNVRFFIETHSEYLIRKLQYLTAKKKIKPEDSVIYYFHHPDNVPEGEGQVKKLEIREDGGFTGDFGPGFFDEATNLKFELLKIKNPQKN